MINAMGDTPGAGRAAGPSRWRVGDAVITSIVESETPGIAAQLFWPEATVADIRATTWLGDELARPDGTVTFRVQAFLVQLPGCNVLVDPCVGNDKVRMLPSWSNLRTGWLTDLAAAGCLPADIDMVVHTHLHEDHVGWDTHLVDGEWVPTFPRARHVYVDDELAYRRGETNDVYDVFADSISPVVEAGLADIVTSSADLGHGVQLVPTPGHTPGHVAVHVATGGEPFVITGDLLHHQCQLAHPHWAQIADHDPVQARTTRGDFFSHHAGRATLLGGTHFAAQPVGRIEADGPAWRFRPEPAL